MIPSDACGASVNTDATLAERAGYRRPDAAGHFGPYGGRFVPEALVAALDELDRGVRRRRRPTRRSRPSSTGCCATTPAGPSPLTEAPTVRRARRRRARPAQARGPQPHRLAQDQQRARPGAAHPADGQDAGDRRDRRRPARRRHRDRRRAVRPGVRRSTWARTTPSARRSTSPGCGCSAPRSIPVTTGTRTLKDAINEAMRDWVTNVETTHYLLGTVAGPHPFPMMVREFQRVIGDEARGAGARADRPAARRGRRVRRRRVQRDRHLRRVRRRRRRCALFGFEAGGDGVETGRHAATITGGAPGVLHGARSYLLQDEDGQTDRVPLDLGRPRLPGRRPRARLPARHRPRRRTGRSPTPRRWTAFCAALPHRGHHPGDRVGARAGRRHASSARELGAGRRSILVNLSGRGDKDVDTAVAYFGSTTLGAADDVELR